MHPQGIDVNYDRAHAKGKYVTFQPLADPRGGGDPSQTNSRTSTVDDGDDGSSIVFADDFSILNRECGKAQVLQQQRALDGPALVWCALAVIMCGCVLVASSVFVYLPPTRLFAQRLQAFPSTDTSVLSLMANLFTQRSLGGGVQQHAALVASTSKMDWRLETTVGSGGVCGGVWVWVCGRVAARLLL